MLKTHTTINKNGKGFSVVDWQLLFRNDRYSVDFEVDT